MRFKNLCKYIVLSLLIIFLTSCSDNTEIEISEDIKADIFEHKKPFIKTEGSHITNLINPNINKKVRSNSTYFNINNYELLDLNRTVTKSEIEEDINFLFEKLTTTYGGYMAFGGDETFQKAKKELMEEIKEDEYVVSFLLKLLEEKLSFIEDAHFQIDGRRLNFNNLDSTKYVVDLEFKKVGNEFVCKDKNIALKNKQEYLEVLKPSLNESGEIVYRMFYKDKEGLNNIQEEIPLVEYKNGDKENIRWKYANHYSYRNSKLSYMDYYDGIPILRLKSCYYPKILEREKERKYKYAVKKGKELSKYNLGILDLRGNTGGSAYFTKKWMKAYTGENVGLSSDSIVYGSFKLNKTIEKLLKGKIDDNIININNIGIHLDGHIIEYGSDEFIEKEGILFVLIDGDTNSGGEWLIDKLRHLENTIIVGVPSGGSMVGSINQKYYLPNSNIQFSWGNMYLDLAEDYFLEYYGYEPDIWIEPINAEESVLKLIKRLESLE